MDRKTLYKNAHILLEWMKNMPEDSDFLNEREWILEVHDGMINYINELQRSVYNLNSTLNDVKAIKSKIDEGPDIFIKK